MILPLLFPLLLAGCGKPPMLIQKYVFDYPSPAVSASAPLEDSLKVQAFSVAQAYNSKSMMYQARAYTSESYTYSQWRVNPGYLVTDFLVRDLRNSRLFKAVLPDDSSSKHRFLLEGGVQEIQELDEGETWKAALALNITLLDKSQKEIDRQVLFQKSYRTAEPLTEKTPQGLAQGMSRAMSQLSARIIADVYRAAKKAEK